MSRRLPAGIALLLLLALPAGAQEPKPATLDAGGLATGGVDLTYAWRYAPGDDPARAAAGYDDSGWGVALPAASPPQALGWYRRHLVVPERLVGRPVVIRVAAPGEVELYLDGRSLLGSSAVERRGSASATATFRSGTAVLAARYECRDCGGGFTVRIESPQAGAHRLAQLTLAVFLATVPIVLAFIHFGLWLSNRRAVENLYLTLCLASFAGIVAFAAASELAGEWPALLFATKLVTPAILSSVFFSLMTYYAIRDRALPRAWIGFAAGGFLLAVASIVLESSFFRNIVWVAYFAALVVEVIRQEVRAPTKPAGGTRPLLAGMIVLQLAIILQVLVVLGVIPNRFPWSDIYYVGLVAFAIGTSLFIVNSFDATRRKLERNEGEIESARKLQEAMLPKELPAVPGLEIAAYLSTATDVGGDYYDFREAPDGALVVAIGDAAGHGLAAGAMVTAMKALFASVRGDEDLAEILTRCDGVLRRMDLRLLHMCLALVRFRGRTIEVCSAAMPPALIRRAATGTVEELGAGGLPLGGRLRGTWTSRFAELASGDTVLLASDGLGELLDQSGTPIGFDAVAASFARSSGSPSEIIAHLNREAAAWQGNAQQADDITIVVVGVRG